MVENELLPNAGIEMAEEMVEEVWKRRAEHLAEVVEQNNEGERIHLLVFRLGNEVYGFEVKYVLDIRLIGEIAWVPRVPDWVVGVVANRGRILSVIDLHRFFKLPGASPLEKKAANNTPLDRYQVSVETPSMEIALLVDEVLSVESIPLNQIKSQPNVWGEMRPEYVHGIAQYATPKTDKDSSIIIVLNLPALLADKDLIIEEKIL